MVATNNAKATPRKKAQAIVLIDPGIDPDRLMFSAIEIPEKEPTFTIGEVVKVFFGLSVYWLRWRDRQGMLVYNGRRIGRRTSSGARNYTLPDIEKMVHALALKEAITGEEMIRALWMLRLLGEIHGYLDPVPLKTKKI